jgi:hypothetical protein
MENLYLVFTINEPLDGNKVMTFNGHSMPAKDIVQVIESTPIGEGSVSAGLLDRVQEFCKEYSLTLGVTWRSREDIAMCPIEFPYIMWEE